MPDEIWNAVSGMRNVADFIDDRAVDQLSRYLADTLKMEPDDIRRWLEDFGRVIRSVQEARDKLRDQSVTLESKVKLGEFGPSQQLKQKMAVRMGNEPGGFAWSVNSVVLGLSEIHEKLRLSLEDHLHTDFSSSQVFGKIGDRNIKYGPQDAANS